MNITAEKQKVFAKDFDGRTAYSISISRKNKDGEWESMWYPVKFIQNKKLTDPKLPNKTDIKITEGFVSFYGEKTEFIITEFERLSFEGFQALEDDGELSDCPF